MGIKLTRRLDCAGDRCEKRGLSDRLQQISCSSSGDAPFSGAGFVMCRDNNCRNLDPGASQMVLKLQAGHVRHLQIDDHAFGKTAREAEEKVACGTRSPAHRTKMPQGAASRLSSRTHRHPRWPLGSSMCASSQHSWACSEVIISEVRSLGSLPSSKRPSVFVEPILSQEKTTMPVVVRAKTGLPEQGRH